MSRLSHRTAPSCTYFVTTKTWENRELFRVFQVAQIVIERLLACRDQGAYRLHEFVMMPNHIHLLLTPKRDTSLEKEMQLIKGGSSHQIHKQRGNKLQIWQAGFHEWTIRDRKDYQAKVEYIRMNPVQAGLVERPGDWAFGSANGKYSLDPPPERLGFRG